MFRGQQPARGFQGRAGRGGRYAPPPRPPPRPPPGAFPGQIQGLAPPARQMPRPARRQNTRSPMSLNEKRTQILQLCMGAMLWLPYMEPSSASIFCVRPGHCGAGLIRPEAFAHPVVVLGIRQRPGSTIWGDVLVRVCDVTTFLSTPLFGDRSPQANQHLIKFNESMPIQQHDSPWGYDPNWLQLGMGNIIGQSYVRAQHVWEISIDVLWNYYWSNSTAWSVRLNEDSYYRLMARLRLEPQPYESLTELPVLGPRRLNDFSLLYASNPVYNQPGLGNQPWFGNNPQGAYNGGSQQVDGFNRGGLNDGGTNKGGLDNRGNGGQTQQGGGQPGGINTAWTSNFWRSDGGTYNTNIPTQGAQPTPDSPERRPSLLRAQAQAFTPS